METIFNYIVYKTTNKITGSIYIGIHKTSSLEFDGYLGQDIYMNRPSSIKDPNTHFARAIKKYGFAAFERVTLKTFVNLEDAKDLERWLVDQEFIDRPDTYNMILGGGFVIPTNACKTYIYDIEGNFIKECVSRADAARFIYEGNPCKSSINRFLKEFGLLNGKYQVSSEKVDSMPDYINYKGTKFEKEIEKYWKGLNKRNNALIPVKIIQKTLDGQVVKIWDSLSDCRKAGFTNV